MLIKRTRDKGQRLAQTIIHDSIIHKLNFFPPKFVFFFVSQIVR